MMPSLDVSINMLSLFAFILALGIVVDDAIIVGENVFTHRSEDKSYMDASINGAIEVANPVIFSVLTTITAFLPLVFVSGTMGKFIRVIPFVVIPILAVSLIESLLILPAHLSFGRATNSVGVMFGFIDRARKGFTNRLDNFINGFYHRFLLRCIKHRYITLASAISIFFMAIGIVGGGIVKFEFMPRVDADFITASIDMPIGTPVEDTERAHDYVVQKAQDVINEFNRGLPEGNSILRHIFSLIGSSIIYGHSGESTRSGSHFSEIIMMLTQGEKRDIKSAEVARTWRSSAADVPGADSVTFQFDLVRFGQNIDIRLAHDDFDVLAGAAASIKSTLKTYPGVSDIDDNYSRGKRELTLKLKPEARTLGITEADLGRQVRSAFYGAEALRIQRGRDEVKVMVRYPEMERKSIGNLESLRIRSSDGIEIPFNQAASIQTGRGFTEINRTDRKRVINVTASVDTKAANAKEILTDLEKTLLKRLVTDYPGLNYNLEGEEKQRKESMTSMIKGFLMALFVIYTLLAIPFRSYLQPFIVMSAIPFGFVGAILGHLIMGFELSILSMFGIVALTGVVVNDSLLMINFINKKRKEGVEFNQAIVMSAKRRFRPIILTSLTTSLGLTPIILEKSMQAQFLIPMAISLGFGILFATFITLILVPSLYIILEDLLNIVRKGKEQSL
jgi:multidrug efflux pump subunit AcrB